MNGLGEKVVEIARDFRTEFALARDAREQELMAALLAEGQEDPDAVRARGRTPRAPPAGADRDAFDDADDVEDLLGYSLGRRPAAPAAPPRTTTDLFPKDIMRTAEIRKRWLDYFADRDHASCPSASLVPPGPVRAVHHRGHGPVHPVHDGRADRMGPRDELRRFGWRTPSDIDEVGKTTRHGTFFQMNGNFSFGDYFKEGAITYAWDLVTGSRDEGKYGFDPETVWVTVYHDDDEARQLWKRIAGLPDDRIQARGKKDNYWSTGQPGPAGPARRSTSTAVRSSAGRVAPSSTRTATWRSGTSSSCSTRSTT